MRSRKTFGIATVTTRCLQQTQRRDRTTCAGRLVTAPSMVLKWVMRFLHRLSRNLESGARCGRSTIPIPSMSPGSECMDDFRAGMGLDCLDDRENFIPGVGQAAGLFHDRACNQG